MANLRLDLLSGSAVDANVRKDISLFVLTVAASGLFWWPLYIQPNLDFPRWIPLVLIALLTGLATALSRKHWPRFVFASTIGTFVGLLGGNAIWPNPDGIAASYEPLVVLVTTVEATFTSLVAGLVARKVSVQNAERQRTLWLRLLCCAALGPLALVLTPPLVTSRVARNDRLAAERFTALKDSVERTAAESDPSRICDGQTLKEHYSGPPFSEKDWHFISGNYVKEDGYVFGIYCHEQGGYTIDAFPARERADGTRRFCTDESRRVGCGMTWNLSRYACIPCSK